MPRTTEQTPTTGLLIAQRLAKAFLEKLTSIDHTLGRMLEIQQGPRLNFLAAGTIAGGGTVGTVPQTILAANPRRRGLDVQNLSAAGGPNLTLGLGTTQPQSGTGIVLPPGASWDGRISGAIWPGSVAIVGSAAGTIFSWLQASGPSSQRQNEAL